MAQKGKTIGNMKIGVTLDGTQMGSTLNDINKWIKVSESAMRANLKTLGDAGKSYEGLRVKVSSLEPILEGQAKKVDLLTDRYKKEVSANGEASEAAVKLATQINNAQAKYATYEKQLLNTKKELVYASTGVNSLTDEMKENERVTSSESKALKNAGDATGAFETKQSERLRRNKKLFA